MFVVFVVFFVVVVFFFNDTATTEIYTLSLHDALPICGEGKYRTYEWVHTGHKHVVTPHDEGQEADGQD